MTRCIEIDSVVVATREQVSCDLDGELIILNFSDGVYYGLEAVGASAWELLQERRSVEEIRDLLLEEYDVDAERCQTDLLRLLQQMADRDLIGFDDGSAS